MRICVLSSDVCSSDLIARNHLLQRQQQSNGLRPEEIDVTDDALHQIVAGYTREAGVRDLERKLGKALRKVAVRVAGGAATPVVVDAEDLSDLLGRQRFHVEDIAARNEVPGVAPGLAVTGTGGGALLVEYAAIDAAGRQARSGPLRARQPELAHTAPSVGR